MANVTRRKLLKRAGVGAAVVGAGSMVTAVTAGAAVNPSPETCIHAGGCFACGDQPHCGTCCSCVITVEGCCLCHEFVFCADAHPCHTSTQCPPGWACAHTCCFGGDPICVPQCTGNPHPPVCSRAAAAGATSAGGGVAAGGHHPEPEAPPHRGHGHQ